jgi:hypothetical protein
MSDEPRTTSSSFLRHPSSVLIALYALLALLTLPVFPHFSSPNEFTRWLLVAAAVEHHTLEVSKEAPSLGPRFEDLAVVGDRLYSNKAPGLALASAPGYLLARPFFGPPSRMNLRPMLTAMRWCGATLPIVLLALLFVRAAQARGGEATTFAVASLLFGTPLFAYGLLLFSHALVAAALFAAWVLLYLRNEGGVTAGALIGIAVLSEYPIAIAAAVLVAGLLVTRQWKRFALVLAGGAPFAALLAIYQQMAFGSPFAAAYRFEKLAEFRTLGERGVGGVGLPSPVIIGNLLLHPSRGLLLFSPIVIAGLFALARARRALPRAAFLTLLAVPLAILLVYGGYPNWHGGWNVGPRYIVAMVPFLLFPLAFAPVRWWKAELLGWSVVAVTLTTLTFPFVPLDFPLPWGSLAMPLLRDGLVAPSLLHLVARPLALGVPLVLLFLAIVMATPQRLVPATLMGIALALVAGYAAMSATQHRPLPFVIRAYFEDVYFERPGILDTLAQAHVVTPKLLERRAYEVPFGPSDWPF